MSIIRKLLRKCFVSPNQLFACGRTLNMVRQLMLGLIYLVGAECCFVSIVNELIRQRSLRYMSWTEA
jgi:hypothetical protein